MPSTVGNSPKVCLLLMLLLLLFVQHSKAAPVAGARELREGGGAARERSRHSTCDHDLIMRMMQESCQHLRRRRRRRRAPEPQPSLEGEAAGGEARAARVARSYSENLFDKCCMKTCNMDDFMGVCP